MHRHQSGQSRRWWHRLERQAIAAHERDLLTALQQLAADSRHCRVDEEGARNPAGVLRLMVGRHQLLMAGVLPGQRRELAAMQACGPIQLTAAGRYGRLWWITLFDGDVNTVVAGSRIRLSGESGGSRPTAPEGQVVARKSNSAAFTISGSSC